MPNTEDPDGATPLTEEGRDELLPPSIGTRSQLNEWEQANIAEAGLWLVGRKLTPGTILTTAFATELHERMFNSTWGWAGKYRKTDKNIGVHWPEIPVRLREVLENAKHQLAAKILTSDEIAARLHHGLVYVHPFVNGNGRHSRLMTDLLLDSLGERRFSWGRQPLIDEGDARSDYAAALKAADGHEFGPLLSFVRS